MPSGPPAPPSPIGRRELAPTGQEGTIAAFLDGITVYRMDGSPGRIVWSGDMSIDADGSDRAYHPADWGPLHGRDPLGLDAPENAGEYKDPATGQTWPNWRMVPKWWGVYVDPATKLPKIQGPGDPRPGFFVSTTSAKYPKYPPGDPRREVNSELVPYIAVPPDLVKLGVRVGDLVMVSKGGRSCFAFVADIGPRRKLGEGSIAVALELDLTLSARMVRIMGRGREGSGRDRKDGILYQVFLGSGKGRALEVAELQQMGPLLSGSA